MPAAIKRLGDGVTLCEQVSEAGVEYKYLYAADLHIDNPKAKRALLKRHLDQVKEADSLAFFFGDIFCAMQGKDDRRGSKASVMAEHQTDRYWNSLIMEVAEFFAPYAEHIAVMSDGNHETAVKKRHEIDLLDMLVTILNERHGTSIQHMGYEGWVHHRYRHKNGGNGRRIVTHFHHGSGGGGPVTRGVIQTNRRAAYVRGADYIVYGHVHESWLVETIEVESLTSGRIVQRPVIHLQLPTYKQEYTAKGGGFHHETSKPPKPLGAWWVHHEMYGRQHEWHLSARRAQ